MQWRFYRTAEQARDEDRPDRCYNRALCVSTDCAPQIRRPRLRDTYHSYATMHWLAGKNPYHRQAT